MSTATIELEGLQSKLDEIDRVSDNEWMQSLNERKLAELQFHDRDRDPAFRKAASDSADTYEKFYGNKKYYLATNRSRQAIADWIMREAPGKIFLDYACGNGAYALAAAEAGAALSIGLDISSVSIKNCRATAEAAGLTEITRFIQADAENTRLPDNSVDVAICSGMLHHLDLSYALPELRRVLKPNGKILAVEALDYNPLIKLYRKLTPNMRTEWEKAHILTLKDVNFAGRFFNIRDISYWHIIGYMGGKLPILLPLLDLIDRGLERIPYVNRMSWMFMFVMQKPSN